MLHYLPRRQSKTVCGMPYQPSLRLTIYRTGLTRAKAIGVGVCPDCAEIANGEGL